ncbi:unnamed protein product [Lampetra planeri]
MSTASSDANAASSRAAGATDACLLMVGRLRWCQEVAWRVQNTLPPRAQSLRLEWSEALSAPQLCARHPFALLLLELASRGQARHAALHVSCFVRSPWAPGEPARGTESGEAKCPGLEDKQTILGFWECTVCP